MNLLEEIHYPLSIKLCPPAIAGFIHSNDYIMRLTIALLGFIAVSLSLWACQKKQTFRPLNNNLTNVCATFDSATVKTSADAQANFPLDGVKIEATAVVFNQAGEPIEELPVSVSFLKYSDPAGHIGSLRFTSDATSGFNISLFKEATAQTRNLLLFTSEAYDQAQHGEIPDFGVETFNADDGLLHHLADGTLTNWNHYDDEVGAYVGAIVITSPLPDQTHNADEDNVHAILDLIGNTPGGCKWQSDKNQICPCEGEVGVECRGNQPTGKPVLVNGTKVYALGYVGNFINCCRTCGSMAVSFRRVEIVSPTNSVIHGVGSIFGTNTNMVEINTGAVQKTVRVIKHFKDHSSVIYEKMHWTNIGGSTVLIEIPDDDHQ